MDPNSSLVKPLQRGLGFPMLVDHPVWSQRGVFGDLNAAFNAENDFTSLRSGDRKGDVRATELLGVCCAVEGGVIFTKHWVASFSSLNLNSGQSSSNANPGPENTCLIPTLQHLSSSPDVNGLLFTSNQTEWMWGGVLAASD